MKRTIALIVLGIIGLGQYAYFQLTPLAYKYETIITGQAPGGGDILSVVVTRDWIAGLGGAVIGIILLGIGLYRLRHRKARGADK